MFISSSIFRGFEFWSVNYTSIYENSESKGFKNKKFWGEISNNLPNDSLGTNASKTLDIVDNHCWKYYN